jgi:group I intron endonuclease
MYVYRLVSPSGKSYVGQTGKTPETRLKGHIRGHGIWVKRGRPHKAGTKLHNAFDKYPPNQWKLEVLHEGVTEERIDVLEREVIATFDSIENGYNMCLGGQGIHGYKHTEEAKAKLSALHKGKPKSEEHRAKIGRKGRVSPMKGKILSEEQKAKISTAKKGKKQDPLKIANRGPRGPYKKRIRS